MILAIDLGNTNIVLGGIEDEKIYFVARLSTDRNKTEDEYKIYFRQIMEIYGIKKEDVDGAIISSVVPPLTDVLREAVEHYTGKQALTVGPGIKTGLNILMDNPAQLGSDKVVTAVATMNSYPLPQIIIDMGTATTMSVLDKNGGFLGGPIFPGVMVSHDALIARTSQLPRVSLEAPPQVVGRNTIDCIKSGLILGNAAMMDAMIERIEEELGEKATVIATGGLSGTIIPHCRRRDIICDDDLLIKGLGIIYKKNVKNG